ncbi:LemA family protein [Candidatus Gracilibacteria bacterium]|nr:LemA family protein [Candidatus Gracilibacteria bacterium]
MNILLILVGIIVIFVIFIIVKYNGIIQMRNNRENSFADIDTQLQLRFDLIPNLVNTVKGYATHEKDTLLQVTEARNNYQNAKSVDDKMEANNMLTGALKSIFALAENYPDLKANQNFLQLQTELSDIENKLAAARRFFNSSTNEYNTYIEVFPNSIIASVFNFKRGESFGLENEEAKKNPKVEF